MFYAAQDSDRVRVVFDSKAKPRLYMSFKGVGYHFSEPLLLADEVDGLSVAHNLQVVEMITTSKDGWYDKSGGFE